MDSTGRDAMKIDDELFVVRTRMAADRARAGEESLARVAGRARTGAGVRAWLGRRLVSAGMTLAGDHAAGESTTTTGQPC